MKPFALILLLRFVLVQCDANPNVHDKMYVQLSASSPCILRLNGTQSFGCTSDRNGNIGVIQIVRNTTELNALLESSSGNIYIAVITTDLFTMSNLQKLNNSSNINGVLLIQKTSRESITTFSPDDTCPNRYSGLAGPPTRQTVCPANSPWNPDGTSIMLRKWSIPIFFTNDNATIYQIEDCFRKFNLPLGISDTDHSMCALQMNSHMYAAVSSIKCLKRNEIAYNLNQIRFCAPLGDENIIAPIVPFRDFDMAKKRSFTMVAARLDSTSLFYGRAPGALSTVTSLVSLLFTAKLLYNLTKGATYQNNVLFTLFNGEAYDYIGSGRTVYDMEKGEFPNTDTPMYKDHIALFVELSQLLNSPKIVYYHSLDVQNQVINDFVGSFRKYSTAQDFNVTLIPQTQPLPPSSLQNFLAADQNLSGVVFSSYNSSFTNKYYHSLYDDGFNIKYDYANSTEIPPDSIQTYIAKFSTTLAYTLYKTLTGTEPSIEEQVNVTEVDEILHCYVDTSNCRFLKENSLELPSLNKPPNYYVGNLFTFPQSMSLLTKYLMTYFMSKPVNATNDEDCMNKERQEKKNHIWIGGQNLCLVSEVNFTEAVSPAFLKDDYDWASGQYSTWTESSRGTISVRMFMKPSFKHEIIVFTCGLLIIVASFVALFWIKKNAKELFNYPHLITASNI